MAFYQHTLPVVKIPSKVLVEALASSLSSYEAVLIKEALALGNEVFSEKTKAVIIENELALIDEQNRHIAVRYIQDMEDLLQCLRPLSQEWQKFLDFKERYVDAVAYRSFLENTSQRRRPRFIVSCEQLLYLRSLSFTWTEIVSFLGVSRMAIFRRRQEFGIINDPSVEINDAELRIVLSQLYISSQN